MKHTYHIQGMTCDGCRNHVEQTLSQVAGVKRVVVDLKRGDVSIEMLSQGILTICLSFQVFWTSSGWILERKYIRQLQDLLARAVLWIVIRELEDAQM